MLTAARSWIAAVRFESIDDTEFERAARTSRLARPLERFELGLESGTPDAVTAVELDGIEGTGGTTVGELLLADPPGTLGEDPTAPSECERVSGVPAIAGLVGEPEVDCLALLVLLLADFLRLTAPPNVARDISSRASAS